MKTTLFQIREHSPCGCGCGEPAPVVARTNSALGHIKGNFHYFISGHNRKLVSGLALLMKRVAAPDENGCWNWTGKVNRKGYGNVQVRGIKYNAHRAVFLESGHPIPDGHHLDHLCRNKLCVNPAHMEPVTPRENTLRQWVAKRAAVQQ